MKNKTYRITAYLLAIVPAFIMLFLYPQLPDQIPTNWGIDGTVTYGGKGTIWALVFLSLALLLMFDLLPKIDPRKKNYEKFSKYYDGFCIFMMLFLMLMEGIIVSESFWPGRISVSKIVILLVGILFLFMGNMMPKVKSNFYMGIKTPWTLSDADVWNKTHRLGGILMFVTGAVVIIAGFLLPDVITFYVLMSLVIVVTLIPTIMSYIWYRNLQKEENDR